MSAETVAVLDVLATHVVQNMARKQAVLSNTDAPVDNRTTIRIVTGNPSDEDIAVLTAVFAAAAASASPIAPTPPMSSLGEWGSPTDQHRYGLGSAPAVFVNARYSR